MVRFFSLSALLVAFTAIGLSAASAQSPLLKPGTWKKLPGTSYFNKNFDLGVMKLDVRQALRMEPNGGRRMVVFVQPWISNVGKSASPAGNYVKITAKLASGAHETLGVFPIPSVEPGKQILPVFQPNGNSPEYYRGALFSVELLVKDANTFNNSLQYPNFQP